MPAYRFYVISEVHGLLGVAHEPEEAEIKCFVAAVGTGRTVYLHDRLTEV